ncbi:MAG: AI-2E family transporter [Actinomycetota bacterium]|nr:AI-2E family transporter [Actinomycetota bacterium]
MSAPDPRTGGQPLSNSSRDAVEAVTWQVRVAAAWTWRLLIIGGGLYIFVRILGRVELVALSLVLALFLTAVLHPLERQLHRVLRGPKSLSAALALLIGIAALVGVGWFVGWQIGRHSAELGDQITSFVNKTKHWLQTGPLHLKSSDLDKLTSKITDTIKSHQGQLISGAIATLRTAGEVLASILLILLSTFFLLRDGDEIWSWVLHLFPRAAHERLDLAGRVGWGSFGGYMRGQLLIALFHGISITIVLVILRIPLAPALGVLIFLGSFIPLIGLTVAGSLCVAIALLEHGPTSAIIVGAAIIILLQLEAHLLQPIIMSRSVDVHPLAIAVSVITATTLAGIPGALVAVPLVAFLNSTVRALRVSNSVSEQMAEEVGEAPADAEAARDTAADPPGRRQPDPPRRQPD